MRATLRLSSPAWLAQPRMTSSASPGSTPAWSTAARSATAARSSGRTSFSWPPYRPIGVRTAETITASCSSATADLLLAPELRRALLDERRHALREVARPGHRLLEIGLVVHRILQRTVKRPVDGPLGARDRPRRPCRELLGESAHRRLQLVRRHHLVDQAQTLSVTLCERPPRHAQLERPAAPDKARHERARAATPNPPDA